MMEASHPSRTLNRSALLQGVLLGIVLLLGGGAVLRLVNQEKPRAPIELKNIVDALPNSSMKSYGLRLPRDGLLVVSVSEKDDFEFSAYLVRVNVVQPPGGANTLRFVGPFTAERVRTYDRSERLEQGDYHLTLVNASSREDDPPRSIKVYARLDP